GGAVAAPEAVESAPARPQAEAPVASVPASDPTFEDDGDDLDIPDFLK
ncbi:cell division protein FtsZ, partial [Clavibacter californiensis]